jgi:hypothetical protein
LKPVTTIRGAAAWIDRQGIAALFPVSDVVLPSLWEAVAGSREVDWAIRDEATGKYVSFTPEMAKCWSWKDELPARRSACVGKHLGRWSAVIAPRLVPALYTLTGRSGNQTDFRDGELTSLQREVAEAVYASGPATGPQLRALVGADKKQVDGAVATLQRALVLTNSGLVEQERGWGAIAVDLLARRWTIGPRPTHEDARRELVRTVLASSGEVSAADVAGALGWRVKPARALDRLVDEHLASGRTEDGLQLYSSV